MAEAALHILSQLWLQRLAGIGKNLVYTGRRGFHLSCWLAPEALDPERRVLDGWMGRSCQDLVGDAISLMFQRIVTRANHQLPLKGALLFLRGVGRREERVRLGRGLSAQQRLHAKKGAPVWIEDRVISWIHRFVAVPDAKPGSPDRVLPGLGSRCRPGPGFHR